MATTTNGDLNDLISTVHKLEPVRIGMKNNLNDQEEQALKELKVLSRSSMEIKKDDKSDTWVIRED